MREPLTDVQIAYVAGVVDARGHLSTNDRHGFRQPRIRITTRRRELLHRIAELTGTVVVDQTAGYQKRNCAEHCKDQHVHVYRQSAQWTVDSSRATILLYNVLPYLVAQADDARTLLLAGLERFPPARGDMPKRMTELGWALPSLTTLDGPR